MHDRARRQAVIFLTFAASENVWAVGEAIGLALLAAPTTQKNRYASGSPLSSASRVVGKQTLELGERARERQVVAREGGWHGGISFLPTILPLVGLGVNRISMLRAMTDEATVGLMVWDGKSAGTLLNVFRLLNQNKKVVVYAGPEKRFHELKNLGDWDEFISHCPASLRATVTQRASSERDPTRAPLGMPAGAQLFGHRP